MSTPPLNTGFRENAQFQTTHWSMVLAAGGPQNDQGRSALDALCHDYWFPVYAFVRRRIADPHAASDMTQAFFARLLEKNYLAAARQDRGRFRTFLLTAVQRFMANEWAKIQAQKRGGGRAAWSLDVSSGETRFAAELVEDSTPEREFDRRWALQLLQLVDRRLHDEYERAGRLDWLAQLKPLATGDPDSSYEEAARVLQISIGAARTAVYRLRLRFRELIRAEIAQTVADPADIDDEVRRLFDALG